MLQWVLDHGLELVGAVSLFLSGALALAMVIPGDHPDKELQWVTDFLKKFSKK